MKKSAMICLFILCVSYVNAQQFSYKPINPFFGGDTFNYQQLLNSASAQNSIADPNTRQGDVRSDLERVADNVRSQILSQFSRTVTQQQVDALGNFDEPGTFTAGTLAIEIFDDTEGLVINILDTSNGEETQIIVPN